MIRIGITGASGFLGWHLRARLLREVDIEIESFTRETTEDQEELHTRLGTCDLLVHLAGVNRGDEAAFATNVTLTQTYLDALRTIGKNIPILFTSSTHIDRETPYGAAKRACMSLVRMWGIEHGVPTTNLILPHLFGEEGKPFYNSAVATFCYQLTRGELSEVNSEGKVELLYAQDVATWILQWIRTPSSGDIRLSGQARTIGEAYETLKAMRQQYLCEEIVPAFSTPLERALFHTLRSSLRPSDRVRTPERKTDHRGHLVELVKELTGGQTFFSVTKPGITRGNHYHTRKIERFFVIQGEGTIQMRKLFTDDVQTYKLSGDTYQYIDMPTWYTHNITNTGTTDLITVFWTNEVFNPADPDTFFHPV